MRINDILNEANDDSGDYQQMLAFTRANRVGGVPDEQQIPLAESAFARSIAWATGKKL